MSLRGVENITVPSFDPSLRELDEAGVRWDVRHAIEQGFTATLLALNAGLSPREMRRFVEIAVDEAAGRLQVGVDMPLDSFTLAAELLAFAADAGATHAVLGVPQAFAPTSDDDVHDAYAELAAASSLKLVLPVGAVGFPPELGGGVPWGAYARLAALDTVRAVTVTTWMPQILFGALQMFAGRLEIGIGTPALLGALPLLQREYGVRWLSPSHWELWQSPEQPYIVRYLEHVAAGRKAEALDVHWRLGPARGIAFGAGLLELELDGMPHWTMAKYVSWTVGGNGGVTREPAQHVKPHQLQARQAMLQAIGIEPRTDETEFLRGRSAVS
jgi:4-hydroxy-tetrahydrodipicolinate synthase